MSQFLKEAAQQNKRKQEQQKGVEPTEWEPGPSDDLPHLGRGFTTGQDIDLNFDLPASSKKKDVDSTRLAVVNYANEHSRLFK